MRGSLARHEYGMIRILSMLVAAAMGAQCATKSVTSQTAAEMRAEELAVDAAVPMPHGVWRWFESGVSMPVLVQSTHAGYTPEAMQAGVRGSVILRAVVGPDGLVTDVRVLKSLEASLDASASQALANWQFRPGTRGGEPVSVALVVRMAFTTH